MSKESMATMANCMVFLSSQGNKHNNYNINPTPSSSSRVYQCKTCDRKFSSFQALGGHRASHRKSVRNMIAEEDDLRDEDYDQERAGVPHRDNQINTYRSTWKNKKAHECPICGVEFAIGQALGGHMRRHRNMNSSDLLLHDPPDPSVETTTTPTLKKKSNNESFLCLDLNLTPLENDLKFDNIGSECSRKISPPILNFFI